LVLTQHFKLICGCLYKFDQFTAVWLLALSTARAIGPRHSRPLRFA
jgi:hypothetical protein